MKKILSSLVLSLFLSTQALASPLAMSPSYSSSNSFETETNLEIVVANTDNTLSKLINGFIDAGQQEGNNNEKEKAVIQAFRNEISSKNVQINIQNSGFWIQTEQTANEFQELLEEIQEITPLKKETSIYDSYQFVFSDLAFANIENKLVISDSNQTIFLHDEEVSAAPITLANNEILTLDGNLGDTNFNYSITENSDGSLNSTSETEFAQSSSLDFNTTEHLYNEIPAENPAFYFEATHLFDLFTNLLSESEKEMVVAELDNQLSQELPNYQEVFNSQIAFLVDLNDTIIPDMTLAMANLSSSSSEILTSNLTEFFNQASDNYFTVELNQVNNELNQAIFTATESNLEADIIDVDSFTITYGVLNGNYVISNNTEIISSTKTLSEISSFEQSLASSKSGVTTLSFIDFAAIAKNIDVYQKAIQKVNTETNVDTYTTAKNILNEMNVWSSYGYFDGNTFIEKSEFQIPTDLILELLETDISSLTNNFNTSYYYSPYDDVSPDTWYSEAVSQAYMSNIIDAYDYESESFTYEFQPSKDITRGEFVQMIVSAYELNYESINQYGSEIFSDVTADSYYDYAIGVAYENGIIKGDDNADTFRPDATLNRAEAVQILYNASPLLNGKTSTQNLFKDVKSDAWYANVVRVAAEEEIVKGINPEEFAPSKNLNKAEAITLLIRLVNNEVRF